MLWGASPKRREKGSPVEHISTIREACCARLCCVLPWRLPIVAPKQVQNPVSDRVIAHKQDGRSAC
jgi:hypothetical protein